MGAFALHWEQILSEPRRIEYFRSAEASNLQQFKGFSKDERDEKAKKLINLICAFEPIAIVSGVRGKDYDNLIAKQPKARMRKSLGAIAQHCPLRGMEWTKEDMERFFVKRIHHQ